MVGPVSQQLWIYFVIMVPLTIGVVGAWSYMDRRMKPVIQEDPEQAENRLLEIETRVINRLQKRTLTRFGTGDGLQR